MLLCKEQQVERSHWKYFDGDGHEDVQSDCREEQFAYNSLGGAGGCEEVRQGGLTDTF